ncbi:hypothetical protein DP129_01545 [Clostridium tetani]|uniref:Transposase IS200-like domain-containing protein n=1 Tax=Clostridium tetani TaxID=1513 RepID=A0ABY0EUX1_CLOTA|nr:transposase [Clostridium tetani]RXI40842.1 hypothetical protein DP129_01545 [Clostridium tetani]RXI57530.1 hypothetical protein DP131_04380 [Clostridium tetani]RXI72249.1 hypothetical protein DQN76_04115 [Clostridium tetani]CDI48581.1 transposase IS200-family protein [Clostridium tetani 12124569]
MPRHTRIKLSNGVYHIIMRGSKESPLFRNNYDKLKFLKILQKYKNIYFFRVFSYCLMDTHIHLLIHSNNADISDFMKSINQSYAQYYNLKYDRIGPAFANRFKSYLAKSESHIILLSSYIHNNPKDIPKYKNSLDNYRFSSFGIYTGKLKDAFNLIDYSYILCHFNSDILLSKQQYANFVGNDIDLTDENINISKKYYITKNYINTNVNFPCYENNLNLLNFYKFINDENLLPRNICPNKIINFVCSMGNIDPTHLNIKYNRRVANLRCLCTLLIRSFSNFKIKEVGTLFNNFTPSSLSQQCNRGYELISQNKYFETIFYKFMVKYTNPT